MKLGFYLGRFQPFHAGHEFCLREIINSGYKPVLILGSSDVQDNDKNPFSYGERFEMCCNILHSYGCQGDDETVIDLPDNKLSNEDWMIHLIAAIKLTRYFHKATEIKLFTHCKVGEELLKEIWNKHFEDNPWKLVEEIDNDEVQITIKLPPISLQHVEWPSVFNFDISATAVRSNVEQHKSFIHPRIYKYVEQRLKKSLTQN